VVGIGKKESRGTMKNRRNFGMFFFILLGLVLAALSAHAQTNFWWTNGQSAAQGYNWSTNADWTNNSANGNAPLLGGATNYIVNFANGGGVYTVTNDLGANGYGFLLNQLAFSNDAVTLAGDNLVFSRGMALPQVLQNGASNIVFNAGMILATNLTFGGAGTGGITVNSGILGAASLIMNGTNYSLTLTGNNAYTGGTIVNTGAVVMTGNNNFGAGVITVNGGSLTTTGTNTTTGATTVGTGGVAIFGGLNNLGAVTVNAGTLTFAAGSSNNLGLMTVSGGAAGGTLVVNGVTLATNGSTTAIIGAANLDRSTLIINTNLSAYKMNIGNVAGAAGAVIQNGGTVLMGTNLTSQAVLNVGNTGGGYGYYQMNGGVLIVGQLGVGGSGGSNLGVLDLNGGTVAANDYILINYGGNSTGVLNIASGRVTSPSTHPFYMSWGSGGNFGMVNIFSNGVLDVTANGTLQMMQTASTGPGSVINLNTGGLLMAKAIAQAAAGNTYFNFNGGTLQAGGASTTFLQGLSNAVIYAGGATIDSSNFNITINQNLLAPTGTGVTSVALLSNGGGYIGAPVVTISGGGGTGATAIAQVDLNTNDVATYGKVTNILVTSYGVGYSSTPTVTLSGGGYLSAATINSSLIGLTLNNTNGGLTKLGAGTLTLGGTNTYTGATTLNAGELSIGSYTNIPLNNTINFNGGIMQITGTTITNLNPYAVNWSSFNGGIDVSSSANTVTITNNIYGSGSFTKLGQGTNVLTGSNTFSGLTTLNSGYLLLSNSTGATAIGGNLSVLRTTSSIGQAQALMAGTNQLPSTAIVTLQQATTNTGDARFALQGFSQTIGGLIGLQVGGGTTNLIVEAATDNSTNKPATLTINVAAGSNYAYQGYMRDAAGGPNSLLSVVKDGLGTQSLGGTTVTYTGPTTIRNGTLVLSNATAFASAALTNNGNLTFWLDTGNSETYGINIAGSNGFTKAGAGTLTIGANNTFTNGLTVAGGQLTIGNVDGSFGAAPLAPVTNITFAGNGGVIAAGTGFTINSNRIIWLSGSSSTGTFDVASGQTLYISEQITGPGTLAKQNTGTLYLSNTAILVNATYSNNFTGGVVINAGTIRLANASALGTPSVGSLLTIGTIVGQTYGGALDMNTNRQDLIYTNTTLNSFGTAYNYGALQNGSGSTDMGATGVRNVTLLGSSAIGQDNGKNFSILGVINGNGNYLAKVGNAAMYTFSNLNNIAGLYVNSGTIGIEVINPSNVPLIQVNFGGTLQLYGRTLTNTTTLVMNGGYLSDSGANLIQGQVIMQAPTNAINNASMMTMGGGVSGPGGIMKYNTGTLILTNASYSGVTLIDQGVVEFAGNTAPTTAGSIYINDGGWAAFLRTGGMTYQGTVNSYMGILGYSQNGGAMAVTGLYTTVAGWLNSGLINPSSGGALALMVNSSENINMSAGAGYTNLSLGAMTGSTLNYTGTLTPFGTTYRIGGGGGTLIMVNTNALTGAGMNVVSGMGNGGTVILASSNDASGQATVVAGTTLQLGAGLANGWLATPTIVDNGTLIFNRSDIVTNLAAISGNGALTTIGKGALVINTAQAYAGNTTVGSNSTLRLTGNGMLGANGLGAGDFNMGNVGGLTATAIVDSATAGWTGMTFRVGNAGNGYLALTGGVINAMAGFVMGNANTTTTRVDMAGGTLNVNTFNSGTIQNMVIGNGTGTNTLNINGGQINLYNGASLQMGNAAGANGVVVQSNGIVNIANGSLVLGNSTSTGQYYLAGGTLIASNITRNNGYGGLIFNGGTLQAAGNNGNWISNLSTAIVAGVAIMDSSNYTVTVSNNLTGSGATQWLAKQGVGTLVLAGTNTLAGGIAINAGLVVYSSSNSIAGTITNNASGAVAFGFTNDISSVLANCVLASSAGAIALLGTNANSNVSFASMPNAFLGAATNLTYGGNFTPNGTTYQLGGGGAVLVYTNVIGAGSNLVIGGYMPGSAVSLTANNANDGTVTLSGGVLRAVDGVGLSTAANLVLNGGVFETTGTFSRTLGMAANNIQVVGNVSGFSANGAPATINLNGGGTLQWGGVNFNPTALVLNEITANTNLTFANGLDFDGADRTVNVNATNANSTATISGALINNGGGTAGLIKGGAGTLNLTAAGSYNGNTTINAGTLQVSGSDNVLPTSTTLTLANVSGATFILSNQNQAVAGLTGGGALGGNVQLVGSGTLMVNTAGANQYSGALTGSGNLTMAGAGTLTLANNTNNLSGLTTVRSGTLALTNVSLAGAVNVAAGATLAVNGAIQQGALLGQYYNVAAPNYGPFNSNSPASMLTAFAASNIAFTAVSSVMGPAIDGGRDTAAGYSQGAFIPGPWSPLGTGSRLINQQVIWTGKYNAPTSGKYYFDANADDECAVWIDGVLVVKATGNGFQSNPYVGTVNLAAGLHDIVIAYANGVGNYGFFVDVAQPGGTTNRLLNSAMSYGTLASIGSLSGAQGSTLAINNAYLTITQTLNSTFAGNITGLAGDTLTKMGSGTLTLSGTNSYGAGTIVAGGTLVISGTNAMPGTGLISVTTNGVLALDYTGIQNTLGTRIDSSVAGVLALTPTSANELLDFSAAGANMANAFLGAISNVNYTGTFTPYGSAVANTYVPYTINNYSMTSTNFYRFGGGGATLTNANALVNPYSLMLMANSSVALGSVATYNLAGGLNISTNTLLDLNGTSLTGPLSGVGTITNSGAALATLTVGQDNAAYTPGIVFGGNLNLTKNGSGIWSITNNNSFTGGFTLNSGYFTNAAPSGSTPIGSGNVLLNGGTLVFAPQANTTNITANFAAANNVAGSTFTYGSGISALVVNQGTWTNLALTLGNSAAAANSVFQRSGYGAIIIAANSGMTNLGFKEQVFINGGVAVNNGMVNPTILGRNNDANANLDFLTYASGVGFTNVTYSDTNFFAANNTVIELVNGTYTNYSASAAVYALKMTNGVTMTLSNQMTIGNGAGQAGLILDGGTIAGSSNLMFGAAEGVIAVSRAGGSINAPITGSAGITVIANETLSSGTLGLGGTNIYTGGTRIEGARLSLSNPKQLGYGDVWIYGDYNGGGQLFLNATMTLTNNMHLSGIGAQTDTTPYGAIRFNNSGAQTNIFTGTIELMGDTRLDFGNAAGVATFSNLVYGTGRLMLGANNAGQLSMTYSNTYSGPTELDKGTLRAVDGVGLSPNSLLILNGGTFETGTNFNRTLGFGPGQIRFQSATDGLSANTNLGGNAGAVVFSLNAPGSVVVWGTNNFNPSTLMLNDAYANTSLILSNSLDLNGAARTISVGASAYGLTSTVANAIINSGTPATLTKNGVGVLVLAGTNSGFGVTISAGILRADLGIGIPTNTAPLVLNGGVWETHGLINASLGGQPGQIQFNQNVLGGFSAYGSPVTVNLDRGTTLVWQANSYFNPSALSLQEVSANTSLTFLNNIDLAGEAHTITVNNTNANLAPIISGTINSAGTLWNSILTKNGAGTLVLTGTNTYGSTIVSAGILRADQGVGMATNGLITLAGGIWESDANITLAVGSNYVGNTIQLTTGNTGFNAVTNPITINLTNGAPLVWGTNYFNPGQLVFNNANTPGQTNITFLGVIDINGGQRSINVGSGTVTLAYGLINGVTTNVPNGGIGGLYKYGAGTLVVSNQGALVVNGNYGLDVHMGTLVLASGSLVSQAYGANNNDVIGDVAGDVATLTLMGNSTYSRSNNTLYVGNSTGSKGTLNIQDNARFYNSYRTTIAPNAGSTGIVNQTGGLFMNGNDTYLGGNGGYGYYNLYGGVISNQYTYIGNSGIGIMTMTNGVFSGNTTILGNGATAVGAWYQSGGLYSGTGELKLGTVAGGYGYYQLSGGVTSNNNWESASRDTGLGVLYQSGGTNVITGSGLIVSTGSGTGVVYLTGGLMNLNNNPIEIGFNNIINGRGEMTVANNAQVISTNYLIMNRSNAAITNSTGFLNLNGGVLQVNGIIKGTNFGYSVVNFNGGTLRASANNVALLGVSTGQVDAAYVWNGGAFIDTATNTVTVMQNLITPAVAGGSGVVSIAFANIGGFIGAPYVAINGNGTGAMAVAQFDNTQNAVTNILIVNPGVGYTATPTFTLMGGGSTNVPLTGLVSMATNASGALTKSGSGMLLLSGTNSYTGGTLINSGVVQFASAYAIPSLNSITINSGGALAVAGAQSNVTDWLNSGYIVSGASGAMALTSNSVSENINMASWPTLSLGAAIGSNVTYTGTLTPAGSTYYVGGGGGTIVFTNVNALTGVGNNVVAGNGGGGVVILQTNNNYTGGTLINAGTLQIGASNAATAWFGSSGNITNNGTLLINNTDGLVLNQTISGNGILYKSGNGTTTLNAANSFSGGTIITNGTILVQNSYGLGAVSGAVTIYGSGGSSNYTMQLANNITVSNAITLIGTTAGRTRLANISGSNTLAGAITIGSVSLNPISFDSNSGFLTLAGNISGNTFTVRGNSNGAILGSVAINADLQKTDNGRWLIGAAGQTYSWSNTADNVGTLQMGAANVLPSATVLTMGQGDTSTVIFDLNGFNQTVGGLVLNTTGGTKIITNSSATQATFTISNLTTSTYGGLFGGNLALTVAGSGKVTLSGANTHYGDTLMQAGTLVVSNQLALQNSTLNYVGGYVQFGLGMGTNVFGGLAGTANLALTNSGSGIVLFVGNNNSNAAYSGSLSDAPYALGSLTKIGSGTQVLSGSNTYNGGTLVSNGTLQLGDGTARNGYVQGNISNDSQLVFANPLDQIYSGTISGAGTLTKSAAGVLTLTAANTYAGNTTISNGTLRLGINNALPATSVYAGAAGNLDLAGFNQLLTGVDGYLGVVTNSGVASTLTVNLTTTQNFGGTLAGPANFTVQGGGRLYVSGSSSPSYTGNVIVSNATVLVQGTLTTGGLIQVFNGGTLGGTGALGNVQVNSGGTYSPGFSPGTQLVVSLTLNGGLFNETIVSSNNYSRLVAANGFSLAAGTTNYLHLALSSYVFEGGASYLIVQDNSGTAWNGNQFVLSDALSPDNGLTLTNGATFLAVGEGSSTNLFRIAYTFDSVSGTTGSGNDILLTVIPEPTTANLLVLIGAAAGLRRLLRKRRRL
jgi:autotransporter-associated beta strand protein